MWMILAVLGLFLVTGGNASIRICVLGPQLESCRQMEADLPENFKCVKGRDQLDCMQKVHADAADVTRVDPRALYLGSKHIFLFPLTAELIDGVPYRYQAVAVVSKNSTGIWSAADLRGRSSCHTGVGRTAGWNIPLGRLQEAGLMFPENCDDSELDVVQSFFGSSCAPGDWSDQSIVQQELKRRHSALCSRCADPESCSRNDNYAGYEGALRCLSRGSGEVAFTKLDAVKKFLIEEPDFAERAELLCFEGGRKSLNDPEPCTWGNTPTIAFAACSDKPESEHKRKLAVLLDTQKRYSNPRVSRPDWYYKVFLSSKKVSALQEVGSDRNTYQSYLGDFIHAIHKPRPSCENNITFCVTSEAQAAQVGDLRLAAEATGLVPPISYFRGRGPQECIDKVNQGLAHLVLLDGGDIYRAGKESGLVPIAAELHRGSDAAYYAVAVIKKSLRNVKTLADLKGRRSCHTGMGRAAGWIMPLGAMRSAGLLRNGCDFAGIVSDFFSGSCVPGARDTRYNPTLSGAKKLCSLCVGDKKRAHICTRSSKERYNGYSGSLRCLSENAGDVAFIKHSTVTEHANGRGKTSWDQDLIADDFRLLCADGGTQEVSNYMKCNLGKVPAHYLMASADVSVNSRFQLSQLTSEISRQFGPKSVLFRMLGREPGLLFGGATEALGISPFDATYEDALGEKFLAALRATDSDECI